MADATKKVLIVDDDFALSDMVSEILTQEGCEVYVEHDGEAGVARANAVHPDFLVLDIMMPKMNGIEVLAALRDTAWGRDTPALLLSNIHDPESMLGGRSFTGVEFLLKTDFTIEDLVQKIKLGLAC